MSNSRFMLLHLETISDPDNNGEIQAFWADPEGTAFTSMHVMDENLNGQMGVNDALPKKMDWGIEPREYTTFYELEIDEDYFIGSSGNLGRVLNINLNSGAFMAEVTGYCFYDGVEYIEGIGEYNVALYLDIRGNTEWFPFLNEKGYTKDHLAYFAEGIHSNVLLPFFITDDGTEAITDIIPTSKTQRLVIEGFWKGR